MKNKLLKKLITIAFLTGLSIICFPLLSQAEDDCEEGCGGSIPTWNPPPPSTPPASTNKVTMELMLSVDVSGSINSTEYNLQKQGYINAFRNRDVQTAIELLPNGLAVAIETWSGGIRRTSSWYKINTAGEAEDFANVIASTLNQSSGSGSTNITEALRSASSQLVTNSYDGDVLVIDISGDGFDNTAITNSNTRCSYSVGTPVEQVVCRPLQAVRDNAVTNGIIINGLPIVSQYPQSDRQHELAPYYRNNVIGGVNPKTGGTTTSSGDPVSFIQVAQDFEDFANAIAAKIEKEILIAIEVAPPTPSGNRKPNVINDVAKTPSGSVTVDVLANDSDPDGDNLDIISVTSGQNGTASIVGNRVQYQPNRGFSGTDTFTYTASDGRGGNGTATVTVTIGSEPPIPTETDVKGHPPD